MTDCVYFILYLALGETQPHAFNKLLLCNVWRSEANIKAIKKIRNMQLTRVEKLPMQCNCEKHKHTCAMYTF